MLLERLFSSIAPHQCLGCGAEGHLLCGPCAAHLPAIASRCYRCQRQQAQYRTCARCRAESPLDQVWAVTPYQDLGQALLRRLKFERAQAAAEDIAAAMASRLRSEDEHWLITYVPTAASRVRQRGYDQARLIARALAGRCGLPYAPLLVRTGSQRQLGQSRDIRRTQLLTAFKAKRPYLDNTPILLVDDVITTGATFEAAAHTLRTAGASRVSAVAFAAA